MSIAMQVVSLRRESASSVEQLLRAIEWQNAAQDDSRTLMRGHAVMEATDKVLLKVAVHAAEAQWFFAQGGSPAPSAKRVARPRRRFPWLGGEARGTRQLNFAAFYN